MTVLKLNEKKEEAIDSCISRSYNLHTGYEFALPALQYKIPRLFETGDYYNCLNFVKLGEIIINETLMNPEKLEKYEMLFFTWKVNALTFLNLTSAAQTLVSDRIRLYEKSKKALILGPLNSFIRRHPGISKTAPPGNQFFIKNLITTISILITR
jgi:hypothetical protein